MSTKAEVTAIIDSNIRNKAPKVRKGEHADVHQEITDNVFPGMFVEVRSYFPEIDSVNITIPLDPQIPYNLRFKKQGNVVHVRGKVGNTFYAKPNPMILKLQDIFNSLPNEFLPDNSVLNSDSPFRSVMTDINGVVVCGVVIFASLDGFSYLQAKGNLPGNNDQYSPLYSYINFSYDAKQ